MIKVYLLWVLTSDQYGKEELIGVYSSRQKADRAWIGGRWTNATRVEIRTVDGPVPEKFQ